MSFLFSRECSGRVQVLQVKFTGFRGSGGFGGLGVGFRPGFGKERKYTKGGPKRPNQTEWGKTASSSEPIGSSGVERSGRFKWIRNQTALGSWVPMRAINTRRLA